MHLTEPKGCLKYIFFVMHVKPIIRSLLKNVFWSNIFVGAAFQILDIQQYASGLRPTKIIGSGGKSRNAGKLGPAAILNQNPIFEMASRSFAQLL
jgi:hypothetical protein